MGQKSKPTEESPTFLLSVRQQETAQRKAAEDAELRGTVWPKGTLLAVKSSESSSGFLIVEAEESVEVVEAATTSFRAVLWYQTASCRYLRTAKPEPQVLTVKPRNVIRPVVLEGRYLPTKTIEWIYEHVGTSLDIDEEDTSDSGSQDDEEDEEEESENGDGNHASRGKRGRATPKKLIPSRKVGAKAPRGGESTSDIDEAPPSKKPRRETTVRTPEEVQRAAVVSLLTSKRTKGGACETLQRGPYCYVREQKTNRTHESWGNGVVCNFCNSPNPPVPRPLVKKALDHTRGWGGTREDYVRFLRSFLFKGSPPEKLATNKFAKGTIPSLYHMDCFVESLVGDAGQMAEFLSISAELLRHKNDEVAEESSEADQDPEANSDDDDASSSGSSSRRGCEIDTDMEESWWKLQSERALVVQDMERKVIIDWFSSPAWSWVPTWMGSTHRQHHLVFKKELLAWTALFRNYGESEYELPPVALGLSFYRALSVLRLHSGAVISKVDAMRPEQYRREYSGDPPLGKVLNCRSDAHAQKPSELEGAFFGLPRQYNKTSSGTMIASFGLADVLHIYMNGIREWDDEKAAKLVPLIETATVSRSRFVLRNATTAKLL